MDKIEQDFRIEDIKGISPDQEIWKQFVKKFGGEAYLWMCDQVNGDKIYVPEYDVQLRASRLRAREMRTSADKSG